MGHARASRVTRQFYVHISDEAKRAAAITLPLKTAGRFSLAISGNGG
jgi:hypothetical protein